MVRKVTALMIVCLIGTAGRAATMAQEGVSPRLAAVRFALEQGWQIPRANIVVLTETHLGAVDGRPVEQSPEEKLRETALIAKLLGSGARIGEAKDYLSCRRGLPALACVTSTDNYVLNVSGLFQGETASRIVLYVPPSRNSGAEAMTSAIVDLTRRGSADWVGVRYKVEPHTTTRRH